MSTSCPQCHSVNPDQARFCQACGSTLGATSLQGRTVVHAPTAAMGSAPAASPPTPVSAPTLAAPRTMAVHAGKILPTTTLGSAEQLVPVIDVSGSMDETYDQRYKKLDAAKRAAITLVLEKMKINPQAKLAVVSFDDEGQVDFPLTPLDTGKSQAIQAIQNLQIRGGTDLNEGLKTAGSLLEFNDPKLKSADYSDH